MEARSYESAQHDGNDTSPLFALAETLCDTPGGFSRYDYAKSVWLGSPYREKRLTGDHPWPMRTRHKKEYVYSVPVLAGVDVANGTMLFVGKDNWKPIDDPDAWLVAERHLLVGSERERQVLSVSVDAAHDVRIALAPHAYDNLPPQTKQALRDRPAYAQTVLEGCLDQNYNLASAQLREGLEGSVTFEDIEALESMIVMVQHMRRDREHWGMQVNELRGTIEYQDSLLFAA